MKEHLKSTAYWTTWVGVLALAYIRPMSLGHTSFLISAICACAMFGRGLIQWNSGGGARGCKCAEFHYWVASMAYALYAFKMGGEVLWVGLSIALSTGVYNIGRGLANHYTANNPLILR